MSNENVEALSQTEHNVIGAALFELVASCPHIPSGVNPQYQSIGEKESIGFFTLPGSKYLKWDISGGFTAQVNFQVAYKSFPASNQQRLDSQTITDNIMAWLENVDELPLLSGGRRITKITASNSLPYKDSTGADKSITFAADAVLEYRKKGF